MTLRDHLQAIYDQHGRLTPELVVETARPKDHPLHGHVFDRAVKDAAESWYRHRAHELIQRVRVTYTAPDGEERDVRAFHCLRSDDNVYRPTEEILSSDLSYRMLLRDLDRDIRALQARYGHLKEFAEALRMTLGEAA